MRMGLAISQYGPFARPEAIRTVARAAEELGYQSLWTGDRILSPIRPQDAYPGSKGAMPSAYDTFLDPLTVLTVAAEATEHVRLGTSTLNALWHPPVLLARTLTTLDVISGGRLDVGIGLGWSRDEYEAAGVPWQRRGARLEEWLDVVDAIWTTDRVEHSGERWSVPPSAISPKPVQRPRPPVLLGGYSPATMERLGRRADGWLPVAMPITRLNELWQRAVDSAVHAGRDPQALRRALRINARLTDEPTPAEAKPGHGTVAQLVDYLVEVQAAGVDEVFIDLQQTATSVTELLDHAETIASGPAV
ncbi:LLM class F420-dependent oxidoreductase [Streptomyces oceani]|uniref:Monooxygenase n=1 Tax=Streptomyces oceani TaxID=1075402 RepID=A0A1E7JX59_9ACTN|nr:LLM class F420-dependent oxidoreductase [Streptomyces oceani]OEU96189.1 monooxygenase [Streptomyces oceani]